MAKSFLQDLKAGFVVGSTPWKQQIMLIVGVIASALVIPFILQTTFEAYGIGDILPRAGMDPKNALPAVQATLMATVTQGFFAGKLPWNMISIGLVMGVLTIIIDEILKRGKSGFRFPPLLFALGVYFPFSYVTAFAVGGLVNSLVKIALRTKGDLAENSNGILFASGIIAGEAILGALLTIPFAYYQSTDIIKDKTQQLLGVSFERLQPFEILIGAILYVALCVLLYRKALTKTSSKALKKHG